VLVGDDASPEVFWAIAGVNEIQPGDASTADIDVTHLRSPDAHREHIPGIRDNGPFVVNGTYLPEDESHSLAGGGSGAFSGGGIPYFWKNRTIKNFKVELNAPASPNHDWTFRGYISKWQIGTIGVDDKVGFTLEIMPTAAYDTP
jgi:hypothetical protein